MGQTCEELCPSEILPDIGIHSVIFHNGKGYFYSCDDFSLSTDKRVFECIRSSCSVTATMGPELGSPLIDDSEHSHPEDLIYKEKCILLHTIRQRFLQDDTPAYMILNDIMYTLEETSEYYENESETGEHSLCDVLNNEPFLEMEVESVDKDQVKHEEEEVKCISEKPAKLEKQNFRCSHHKQKNSASQKNPQHIAKHSCLVKQEIKKEVPLQTHKMSIGSQNQQKADATSRVPQLHHQQKEYDDITSDYQLASTDEIDLTSQNTDDHFLEQYEDSFQEGDVQPEVFDLTEDSVQNKTVRTQRRHTLTDKDGYMYCVNRTVGNRIYLRCSRFRTGCFARAVMKEGGEIEPQCKYFHNHKADLKRVAVREFTAALINEVEKEIEKDEYRPLIQIFNELVERHPDQARYVNYATARKAVRRAQLLYR